MSCVLRRRKNSEPVHSTNRESCCAQFRAITINSFLQSLIILTSAKNLIKFLAKGTIAKLAFARQTRGHVRSVPFHWFVSVIGEQYETEGDERREATSRTETANCPKRSQPRLSYVDCSEQLDFNANINPFPLNFI